jgi:DNA-directed RNA polymerase subunit beta
MEIIKKQMKTEDAQGWHLLCDEKKSWTEDEIDDETGEPVSVERTEVLLKKGVCLTALDLSTLLENGITNVRVSNVPLKGDKRETMNLWETVIKVDRKGKGEKKKTYIVTAESPTSAETFISNYLEVNVECVFESVKVNKVEYNSVIKLYDTEREEYERDGWHFAKWYKSQIFAMIDNDTESGSNPSRNILVQATDFETALNAIKTVMGRNEYYNIYNTFKSMQELNIEEVFIPDESVSYYSNEEL